MFPTINQLFSTPQVPHFPPSKIHFTGFIVHELLFLVLADQTFSLYFMICRISSHPMKVKAKNSWKYNELFSHSCCQKCIDCYDGNLKSKSNYRIGTWQIHLALIKASKLQFSSLQELHLKCQKATIYKSYLHKCPVVLSSPNENRKAASRATI